MARTRRQTDAAAADGEIVVRKARTARHRPCAEGEVVVVDILDGWAIDLALFPIWRVCKWKQACKVRERSTKGNRGKTQAKFVAQVLDRDCHGRGRYFGM
jgi:hypothetical protein